MNIKKLTLISSDYPERLRHLSSPPDPLYHMGASLNELLKQKAVAIVGTRKITPYGRQATIEFASELAGQGVVIISGLALGLDALAHRTCLDSDGLAIGVLPCPLDKIVPVSNQGLARQILDKGGALVSEYPSGDWPKPQYFIARNRIVSGLADAVLIPEAGVKSGARYTARFGLEQNKQVLAVPGNIKTPGSIGTNNLIKHTAAAMATEPKDVLLALGLHPHKTKAKYVKGSNVHEQRLLDLMLQGISAGDELIVKSGLGVSQFNQTLTMLEIAGKIRPLGANHWSIY